MRDVWTRCDLLPVLFRDRTFSFFFYAWWKLFWVVSFSCSASFHELELSPHLGHGAHHVGLCWVLLSTLFDNVHDVNMVSRGRWIHMMFAWGVHDVDMVSTGITEVRGRGSENFCMVCA